MRYLNYQKLRTAMCFMLLTGLLAGCLPGPGSPTNRPARKKMLTDGISGDGIEAVGFAATAAGRGAPAGVNVPAPPFTLVDSVIGLGGENADFFVLRIPTSQFDFLLPMAQMYEPYLAAWLTNWPLLGRKGLAIDLTTNGQPTRRANFQLEYLTQQVSFPLIVLSDEASAGRLALLTQLMGSLNSIHCENLNK